MQFRINTYKILAIVLFVIILWLLLANKMYSQQIYIFEGDTIGKKEICKNHIPSRIFYLRDIIYTKKYPYDSCKCVYVDEFTTGIATLRKTYLIKPNCRPFRRKCLRCGELYIAKPDTFIIK